MAKNEKGGYQNKMPQVSVDNKMGANQNQVVGGLAEMVGKPSDDGSFGFAVDITVGKKK